MVQIMAALGLVEIGDKDSIPLIIDAGNKMPAEPAATMAEALVYFDDHKHKAPSTSSFLKIWPKSFAMRGPTAEGRSARAHSSKARHPMIRPNMSPC